MTPFEIEFMLECHCNSAPIPDCPIGLETVVKLRDAGLITRDRFSNFILTDGGSMYVQALQDVPMPVKQWAMPSTHS